MGAVFLITIYLKTTVAFFIKKSKFIDRTSQKKQKLKIEGRKMKCTKCGGEIDTAISWNIKSDCGLLSPTHPCKKCGKLHWPSGAELVNRAGQEMFLKDNKLIFKDRDGPPV